MPDKATLRSLAQERLEDARALFNQGRYDGAAYICGYAVEFALKARICDTLDVDPYPEKQTAFEVHDLGSLLLLSGRRKLIISDPLNSKLWSTVTDRWRPDMRYQAAGAFSEKDAREMIAAIKDLLLQL